MYIRNKGITLIALVITIIVLLILAGVTINTLFGDNRIIKKAEEAKNKTEQTAKEEANSINTTTEYMNQLGNATGENNPTIPDIDTGSIASQNSKFIDSNGDTATIPKGFKVLEEAKVIKDGLVIEDDKANQFVWIPVPDRSKFKRTEGYANGSLETKLSNCGEADATGTNDKVNESITTKAEAIAMYESVSKNKGFYIARFEAGKETVASVDTIVSKKNATVWNSIPWSNSDTMNIDAGGAVEKARNMYTDKNKYGVTSTLCYGVQWDATCNFMDPNYITNEVAGKPNCGVDSYLVNSTGKGNYGTSKNNVIATGSNETYCVNNIYDMAGNVWEWTAEVYDVNFRVVRGGGFYHGGFIGPVSMRGTNMQTMSEVFFGFRPTLYL